MTLRIEQPTTEAEYKATGEAFWRLAADCRKDERLKDADSGELLEHFADVASELSTLDRDTVVASMRAYRKSIQ